MADENHRRARRRYRRDSSAHGFGLPRAASRGGLIAGGAVLVLVDWTMLARRTTSHRGA